MFGAQTIHSLKPGHQGPRMGCLRNSVYMWPGDLIMVTTDFLRNKLQTLD